MDRDWDLWLVLRLKDEKSVLFEMDLGSVSLGS